MPSNVAYPNAERRLLSPLAVPSAPPSSAKPALLFGHVAAVDSRLPYENALMISPVFHPQNLCTLSPHKTAKGTVYTVLLTALQVACLLPPLPQCVDAGVTPKWYVAGIMMLVLLFVRGWNPKAEQAVEQASLGALLFEALYVLFEVCVRPQSVWTVGACGTFDNPGSMAFSACVLAAPAVLFLHRLGLRSYQWGVACLLVVLVLLSKSRTGLLALALMAVLYAIGRGKAATWKLWAALGVFVGMNLVWVVAGKADSSRGRWFIAQRTWELIEERPLAGHGRGGFVREYMSRQGDYFSLHPDSPAARLADEVRHPLCEFLLVWVDYGIAGPLLLSFLLVFPLVRLPRQSVSRWTLPVLLLFCVFSYPLTCPLGWLTLCYAFCELPAGRLRTVLLVASFGAFFFNSAEKVLRHTGLLPSPYCLYNKASREYRYGSLVLARDAASECATLCSSYNLELLRGDIERHFSHYSQAIGHYERALAMCPARFAPLEGIYWTCVAQDDMEGKVAVLRRIARKPVKVMSPEVKRIKELR